MTTLAWLTANVLHPIVSGHIGRALPDDIAASPTAMVTDYYSTEGICAAEGANYWSWDGVVELLPHGRIRMTGMRTEHDSDGEVLSEYQYNREYCLPQTAQEIEK